MIDVFDSGQEYDFDPKKDIKMVDKTVDFPNYDDYKTSKTIERKPIPQTWEADAKKDTTGYDLDPESFGGTDFPPLTTPEDEAALKQFYEKNPDLSSPKRNKFDPDAPWIQTYSGRRFCPTNPIVDAVVIQDIAHSLSMQCRFSGHTKKFYSVAQHCVLVSYICDMNDALWGLMHDASEAYLVDVPSPLKHSGKLDAYKVYEEMVQTAICQRFNLPIVEPLSVHKADKILLATEARDLMSPLHSDWKQPVEPLPMQIIPLPPQEAKNLFMKRFFELSGYSASAYDHYLNYEDKK